MWCALFGGMYNACLENPPFEVFFTVPKKSKYRKEYSFACALKQPDILAYTLEWDDCAQLDVREVIEKCPSPFHLFRDNPLENNCFLHSIVTVSGREFRCCVLECLVQLPLLL